MRERLLELVVCPVCGCLLRIEEGDDVRRDGDEIIAAALRCSEGHRFPVVNGVPRLLPPELLAETLARYHPQEYERYRTELGDTAQEVDVTTSRTLRSFSYQWNVFSDMFEHWEENFRSYFEPLVKTTDFEGQLVLDAGCGFGRHAYYAGRYGAEVVAMDLSEAVEAAFENTRSLGTVHVVQGNIYQPPVAARFDLVYCVGVIQHLPEPAAGFASLCKRLREGGRIFVWVYGRRRGIYRVVDVMRKLTTRVSMSSLHRLTWGLNVFSFLAFSLPYKMLRRVPGLAWLASRMPFTRYADLPLRVGHADWFDRLGVPSTVYFSRQDVENWFADSHLRDVALSSRDGIGWRAVGTR